MHVPLDQRHLGAERRGDGRARVAGGPAADDHETHRTDAGHGSRVRDTLRLPCGRAGAPPRRAQGRSVIVAPERAARPHQFPPPVTAKDAPADCPFCHGNETLTPPEVHRTGAGDADTPGWRVRVVPNLYPIVGGETRAGRDRRARGRRPVTRPRPLVRAARRRRRDRGAHRHPRPGPVPPRARRPLRAGARQPGTRGRARRSRTRTRSSSPLDLVPPAVAHAARPVPRTPAPTRSRPRRRRPGPPGSTADRAGRAVVPARERHAVRAARRAPRTGHAVRRGDRRRDRGGRDRHPRRARGASPPSSATSPTTSSCTPRRPAAGASTGTIEVQTRVGARRRIRDGHRHLRERHAARARGDAAARGQRGT